MADILKEILKEIPEEAKINTCSFEGANIILYTRSRDFFLDNKGIIKKIVDNIKKRVELRPDPSLCLNLEDAEYEIKKILPKEAGLGNIIFDSQRSVVIIEAEKPGLAIGKGGGLLKEIKEKIFWVPVIIRVPAIRSKLIENIRGVLYENNDYRKKFLNKVGKRIYNGWVREKQHEWVRISFLGGARQVGRSCLLLQTQESRILLDCGIDVASQGSEMFPFLDAPEFDIKSLDAVIISHSHLDHSGLLPYLYKMGYDGPCYFTKPTRDITALLALDFIGVSQKEATKSLFTSTDVKNMVKHSICLDYEEVTDITPDVRLTFYNAGHTLGSSMCHLHIGNGLHNLLYTSDMNFEMSNLLQPSVTIFPRLETVIIEGTYGGREDNPPSRKECEIKLIEVIKKTVERKGKVLMPVLGVGRSQEIMLVIEKAVREGRLEKLPIYVQGMVWDVTAIHTAYPDFFNKIIKKSIFHKDKNPFLSDIFKRVGSHKEMEEVIESEGPCIIIATSGMLTGGASVEYLKHLAENKNNTLVFTSYQGEGSLGRKIQMGEKQLAFSAGQNKQEIFNLNMEIDTFQGFSGHSSRQQLLNFFYKLEPKPKKIIVLHGESSKCLDLSSSLHKLLKIETIAPKNLETIRLR